MGREMWTGTIDQEPRGTKATTLASSGLYPANPLAEPFPRNLALAILLQAFRDAIPLKRPQDKDGITWRRDATVWFFSDDRNPGSFHWVCEILQLEPWTLRRWLITYRKGTRRRKEEMARELFRCFKARRVESSLRGAPPPTKELG